MFTLEEGSNFVLVVPDNFTTQLFDIQIVGFYFAPLLCILLYWNLYWYSMLVPHIKLVIIPISLFEHTLNKVYP